ncbi:Scarecrow-like protein 3 [Dichanthelium oligosanthes]|uniref:Scarecrow-like protein 3 n=1 Tax=Dichanthelium oligosanthes TaxID=888268 RepID=A0A1E5UMT1_9POAL|nr:Scarecrow-like protein 3 [Dichanthelium oligosanthes]
MPPPLVSFLAAARALLPKIVLVTEQDANHNGASFRKRFAEALGYDGDLYDSLDAAAAAYRRPAAERAEVERAVLGEEIRGALLHEGAHPARTARPAAAVGDAHGAGRVPEQKLLKLRPPEHYLNIPRVMYRPSVQDQGTVDQAQLVPALYECAAHVIEGSFEKTDISLSQIKSLSSIVDGPLQRLSLIFADSLARRLLCPIQGFAGALIHPSDYFEQSSLQSARCSFTDLSPYIHTGFVTINRAILEAMEVEKVVHIIDLSCSTSHPRQWLKLLHDFHRRQGGPPEVRLTVVNDDNDFLANMQMLLSNEADKLKIPFQFKSVIGRLETLDFSNLRDTLEIKYGEAIAISCSLQMHRLLLADDSATCSGIGQLQKMASIAQLKQMASSVYSPVSTLSPQCQTPKLLTSFLNAVRGLKPNIMLLMEQDANHNALLFCDRFMEALNYYAALFDSFHAVAAANPRKADERARVERMILGEEIKNILVCEGVHRHERHERLSQWAMHMDRSGFEHVPLSFHAIWEGKTKLMSFGLDERQGKVENDCLLLCWGSTHLYSISAWRPYKGSTSGSRDHMLVQPQRQIIGPNN